MEETAKHTRGTDDSAAEWTDRLKTLDPSALSFVQLKRLQTALQTATDAVNRETAARSDADDSGDTVRVEAPEI